MKFTNIKIRHLIVTLFALNYLCTIFGWKLNCSRTGTIILPLFLITVVSTYFSLPTIFLLVLYFIDIVAVFFGFIYFIIKPIKWDDLNNSQKLQFGIISELTGDQYREWLKIYEELINKND